MQTVACALTMVRDDLFFLKHWLRHYGGTFGRENCYIVNHGRGEAVARLAEGCEIIGIPGEMGANFDAKRWRLLNNIAHGLRGYYTHVVVGDVDELVVTDPAQGDDLLGFLRRTPPRRVLTPVGLELVHLPQEEPAPAAERLIGPRRHVRLAPDYSKPCILSTGVKIARGGHFTQANRLETPEGLYLLHLKYADYEVYREAMDRRNALTGALGVAPQEAAVGRHWFAEARVSDEGLFQDFARLPRRRDFDLSWLREHMHLTWRPRGTTGFWEFDRQSPPLLYELPDRFVGLV